jgi:Transposase DDE domain group 1
VYWTVNNPLFLFNQFGDLERCALRPGNVHSADGWQDVLDPVVARYRGKVSRIYFRADAAFANPDVYEFLEGEGTNVSPNSEGRKDGRSHRTLLLGWVDL